MEWVLAVIAVPAVFAFGLYVMKRLDGYLEENYGEIQREEKAEEPSCVMLTDELSDEEIIEEIRRFCDRHEYAKIFLWDSTDRKQSTQADVWHFSRRYDMIIPQKDKDGDRDERSGKTEEARKYGR